MSQLTQIKVLTCPVIVISFGSLSSFSIVEKTFPSSPFPDYLFYKSLLRTDLMDKQDLSF